MKNVKILTLISSIIDIVFGLALVIMGLIVIIKGVDIPDDAGVAGAFGVAIVYAVLIALSVIGIGIGIVFLGYGITFLILSIKQTKNSKKKGKAFFVVAIIEYIIAGLSLVSIIFNSSTWYASIAVSAILIATATLKIVDAHKIKKEKMLEKPAEQVTTTDATENI